MTRKGGNNSIAKKPRQLKLPFKSSVQGSEIDNAVPQSNPSITGESKPSDFKSVSDGIPAPPTEVNKNLDKEPEPVRADKFSEDNLSAPAGFNGTIERQEEDSE